MLRIDKITMYLQVIHCVVCCLLFILLGFLCAFVGLRLFISVFFASFWHLNLIEQ